MKTKVVQHVSRIFFYVFKFSGFQFFKNLPGSQLLSVIQTFFMNHHLIYLLDACFYKDWIGAKTGERGLVPTMKMKTWRFEERIETKHQDLPNLTNKILLSLSQEIVPDSNKNVTLFIFPLPRRRIV